MDQRAGSLMGSGADYLGISGSLGTETFHSLLRGENPVTGQPLFRNTGADSRTCCWDMTFSAIKSLSVLYSQLDPIGQAEIEAILHDSLTMTLEHVQKHIPVGRNGTRHKENCKLFFSTFLHESSREGDPQLHLHCLIYNLGIDNQGNYVTLDIQNIFKAKKALGSIFRAILSQKLMQHGYSVEREEQRPEFTQIPFIDPNVCTLFSKRRQQILQAVKSKGFSKVSPRILEIITRSSRKIKSARTREEVLLQWRTAGETAGFGPRQASKLRNEAKKRGPAPVKKCPKSAVILSQLTENESVFRVEKLWEVTANEFSATGRGYNEISQTVATLTRDNHIRAVGTLDNGEVLYTTREMIVLERDYCTKAYHARNYNDLIVSDRIVDKAINEFKEHQGFSLNDEQIDALRHVTAMQGQFKLVKGPAGTGKTSFLTAANSAWIQAGYTVVGAAMSARAAEELEKGSGIPSTTLHSLLCLQQSGQATPNKNGLCLSNKHVLVVDEAGLVDSRMMHSIINLASRSGTKVAFVGDEGQMQAIRAGGAFRALQSILGYAELRTIQRQSDVRHRNAVYDLEAGRTLQALKYFVDTDAIHLGENQEITIKIMSTAIVEDFKTLPPSQIIGIANTRSQVREINRSVREHLIATGKIVSGVPVEIKSSTGTPAGVLNFAIGDRVAFTKNDYKVGVKNGQVGTISKLAIVKSQVHLTVTMDSGKIVNFDAERYPFFDHGYAVTTYKSQGLTVQRAHVILGGLMQSREASYVSLSRAKIATQVYVNSNELTELSSQIHARPTPRMLSRAMDISQRLKVELSPVCTSDLYACREWLREQTALGHLPAEEMKIIELTETISAMQRSVQKNTTLDYIGLPELESARETSDPDMELA